MLNELYFFFIYLFLSIIFIFTLALYYSPLIIVAICNYLNEGVIIHDSTEWVWAIWTTAFFLSFWLVIPYFFYLLFIWTKNLTTLNENLFVLICIILFFYFQFLSIVIFLKDLFISGFFLPNINEISFEFQPELEKYLAFIFGLFFDLFNSFVFFQLFVILVFFFKSVFLQIEKYIIILHIFSLLIFFYWFGGEGFFSDFCLVLLILIFLQVLIYTILFFKQIRKYKN